MGVAEGGDDGRLGRLGRLDGCEGVDHDEAAANTVAATEEGVDAVAGVDLVCSDDVLGERLGDLAVGESTGCTICLHRPADPASLFKRTVQRKGAFMALT